MKTHCILLLLIVPCLLTGQVRNSFRWGNSEYFNLSKGEKITIGETDMQLMGCSSHFNLIRIGADTLKIVTSRNSLPVSLNKLKIFVADNRFLKEKSINREVHGLLTGDALICVSTSDKPMLDPLKYRFPVDFTDGFQWSAEEESAMFSFCLRPDEKGVVRCFSHEGIDFDLSESRLLEKHLIVAIENSSVVWIEENHADQGSNEACVLLRSHSDPAVYYIYQHLNNKKLYVRKGQKLVRGDEIGYTWGSGNWGNLQFAVVKTDTVPAYNTRFKNALNIFPQLFELYAGTLSVFQKSYTRGSLSFGKAESISGNIKNTLAFSDLSGKGWQLGEWNPADRVESMAKGVAGNARLRKTLFRGTSIECINPDGYYDYEINVSPGVYRIRAEVGDVSEPSWQKVEFEGVLAGTFDVPANGFKWTTERAVKVTDGRLTIRIFLSPEKVAGLSSLVFQKAY